MSPAALAGAGCQSLPHRIEGFNGGTAEPALSLHASRFRPEH